MDNTYQDGQTARKYLEFLNSENGKMQQDVLYGAIFERLPKSPATKILDAGCGPGWLLGRLNQQFSNLYGCDSSEAFISYAKKNYSAANFQTASLEENLPYEDNFFDAAILNMVAPDIGYLPKMFANIYRKIAPSGILLMTIPNPYYTEPVAEWKRSVWDLLSGKKPQLKIKRPYVGPVKIEREFHTTKIASHFYPLSTYINTAQSENFTLAYAKEITSQIDSPKFNLQYQLYRYPLLLLLEFRK